MFQGMGTDTVSGKISGRIILLLLAAVLLTGLGRILVLPVFEGYDENAHYSRIQGEAFATPGTRRRRARIFQYAVIDMSSIATVFDERPIFMTRLVAESGCIMTGGAAQVGRMF